MNALELLKTDHRTVDSLFQKVKATDEASEQMKLYEQIAKELEVHTHIEETIFYPYLQENGDEELQDIVKEGIEEHHQAKMFLREIGNLAEESEKLEPKLKVLIEDVEHHVTEEEGEMFKMCEEQFDEETLNDLGAQMEAEKKAFSSKASSASSR